MTDFPFFGLKWSPTTTPLEDPDWVDISDRLVSFTCQRGRQFELDRIEAGSATIIIEDETRSFDPTNIYSEYYPNVLPLKKFQLYGMQDEDTTYSIFTGYFSDYKTIWESPDYVTVEITGTDGFDIIANADIVSDYASHTTTAGGNSDLTITSVIPGAGGNSITITSGGSVDINGVDVTIPGGTASAVMATINADVVVGTLLSATLAPGSDGSGTFPTLGTTNLNGGTFVTELTGSRINSVLDNIGWPAGARAIDPGTVFVIAHTSLRKDREKCLSHIHDVENSGLGIFFIGPSGDATFHEFDRRLSATLSTTSQATFGDADPDDVTELEYIDLQPGYDDIHIYNIIGVTPANSDNEQVKKDDTSILQFGERSFSVNSLVKGTTDARSVASFILKHFKDPGFRFNSLTFKPITDGDMLEQAFSREISDRVTVNRRPPDHSGLTTTVLSQDCFIESIAWSVQTGGDAEITWLLSPAIGPGSGYTPVMLLDTGLLDTAILGIG